MDISASLPERYGVFETIRQDNYPFNHTFTEYIELIARIGLHHNLSIVNTIGFIEDGIMQDDRLPDIPEGDEPVQFRIKVYNDTIQEFYEAQDMPNRQITFLIIVMTLRLSERYGTSLYRIYAKIEEIGALTGRRKRRRHTEDAEEQPLIKTKKRQPAETKPKPEPKQEEPEPAGEPEQEKPQEDVADQMEQLASRAEKLMQKKKAMDEQQTKQEQPEEESAEEVEEQENQEEVETSSEEQESQEEADDEPVVTTNPALADFFAEDDE